MAREIKTTLALDGEQKFKQGLQSIDRELRVMSSQLDMLSSQYNTNAGSVDNIVQRYNLMREKSEALQNKVNALQGAVDESSDAYKNAVKYAEEMAKAYGENSEEALKAQNAVRKAEEAMDGYRIRLANAENQLNQNNQALRDFERETGAIANPAKAAWEKITGSISGTVDGVKKFFTASKAEKFQRVNVAVAKITPSFKEIASKIKDVTVSAAQMSVKLTAEIGKISFKSAEAGVKAFTATTEKSLEVSLKAFTAYTENVAKLGTKIGKWAVETGMSFDSQMSAVASISGAEGEEFDRLAEKAKEMGETTSFSATESAKALEYMAMAGWSVSEMETSLESLVSLTAASGEDLATVSDIVTDAMTAFGMTADETERFADVLAKTASSANTNVGIMGETFQYVAPLAGAMGYSIEDMSVAIGLMANAGVKGTMSGTALRNIITNLVQPTDEVAAAMETLGVSLTDSEGNAKDFREVVGELRNGFSGLTETEKASYAATIGGQRAMSGLLALVNSSDEDFDKLTASINDSAGAAKNMADVRLDNLAGDVTLLKSNLEGVALSISDKFNPSLRWAVQSASDLVTAFKGNGVGGALKHFSTLIPEISDALSNSLPDMLDSFMSGTNDVIISIVNSVNQLLPTFTSKVLPVAIKQFKKLATSLTAKLPELLPNIVDGGLTLFNGLLDSLNTVTTQLVESLPEIVSGIGEKLNSQGSTLLDKSILLFKNIIKAVETVAGLILPKLPEIVGKISDKLIENAPDLLDSALTLFEQLIKGIDDVAEKLLPKLPELITSICDKLIEHSDDIISAGFDLLEGLASGIVDCIPTLLEKIPEVITNLATEFTKPDNLSKLIQAGVDLIVALAEGLPKSIVAITEAVPVVTQNIIDTIMETDWLQVGKDIVEGILSGFLDVDFEMDEYISEFGDNWVTGVKEIFGIHSPSKLMRDEVGKYLALGVGEGFTDNMKSVTEKMEKSIPKSFDTTVNLDAEYKYRQNFQRMDNALSGNFYPSNNVTNNYNTTQSSPIYITIQNADMSSSQDINAVAEKLGRAMQMYTTGIGMTQI